MDESLNHSPLKLPIPKKAMIVLGSLILVGWAIVTVILFVEYRKSKALLTEYSPDDPKNKKLDGLCLRFYFPYRLPVCHLHRQVRGFGPVAPSLQRLLQSSETAPPPGDNLREGCAIL